MSDDLVQKVFDKLDTLSVQVAVIACKLDAHLAESVLDKATTASERSGLRVNVTSWVIIGLVSTIGMIALYAVKHGWRP